MTILDIIQRSNNAFVLFGYLIEESGNGKDIVYVSQRKIAKEIGMSLQVLRTALNTLEELGVVTLEATLEVTHANGIVMLCKLSGYKLQNTRSNTQSNTRNDNPWSEVDNPEKDPVKEAYNKWIRWMLDGHKMENNKLSLTFDEFAHLADVHTLPILSKTLADFYNQGEHKKYRSLFQTMNNWCKNTNRWNGK